MILWMVLSPSTISKRYTNTFVSVKHYSRSQSKPGVHTRGLVYLHATCLGVQWDHSCGTEWEHQRWFRFRLDLFCSHSHCGMLWETYPSEVPVSCKKTHIPTAHWLELLTLVLCFVLVLAVFDVFCRMEEWNGVVTVITIKSHEITLWDL